MPENDSTTGYVLNALDRQSKLVTTQGVVEKILGTAVVILGGWCVHLTRKVNRLEKKIERMNKRTEE